MRTCILIGLIGSALWGGSIAGLKWAEPAGWKNEGSRTMRAATYDVPPAAGDSGNTECVVYFFGEGQGGSVESNLSRWKGQVTDAAGQPAPAKVGHKTVHGLKVTTLDASGSYAGMSGPAMTPVPAKGGSRMLAAIVEWSGGNIYIKFAGSAKTIAANQAKFDQLVNSFEPGTQLSASR